MTKLDNRNYNLVLNGTVRAGQIDFDLRALMDLSDNFLTNPQFTITGSSGATNVTVGSNLSGTNAGIYNSGTGTPTFASVINESEVTSNSTTFRVCLTNVGAGLGTEVFFDIYRDDVIPTMNSLTADTVARRYSIMLTCTDNADKIAYSTNGTAPFTYRCIDKAGNVSGTSSTYNFKSALTWDQSNWSAAVPTPPYDVWK